MASRSIVSILALAVAIVAVADDPAAKSNVQFLERKLTAVNSTDIAAGGAYGCTPENKNPKDYGGAPCCLNPVTQAPYQIEPFSNTCTKCFYVREFTVDNQCDEDVVIMEFGTVPSRQALPFGPIDKFVNRLGYSRASRTEGFQNDGIEIASGFLSKVSQDGKIVNPNPQMVCGAPDWAPWAGWSIPAMLVAFKANAPKTLHPENLAGADPGSKFTPEMTEAACAESGGAWMCTEDDPNCMADGIWLKPPFTYMDCTIPNYEACADPGPGGTGCPGSAGQCGDKNQAFNMKNMWALNGHDGTWSNLHTKQGTSAGPPAVVGYWSTPEQPCWNDWMAEEKMAGVGWLFDAKQRNLEVDLHLQLCNVHKPAPTPAPPPTPPTPSPTNGPGPDGWTEYPAKNCYNGKGGNRVCASAGGVSMAASDCKKACGACAECTAIVTAALEPGLCELLNDIQIDQCEQFNSQYNLWLAPKQ